MLGRTELRVFHSEHGQPERIGQPPKNLWLPIPGNVHDQVEWGPKQADLVEDVPGHDRVVGTR